MPPSVAVAKSKNQKLIEEIHEKALTLSRQYRRVEFELIEVLQAVDRHRVFLKMGYSSPFAYAVGALSLSESVAYNLIAVSRKAREVPELKDALQTGAITLSNARKIAPILNVENKIEWLEKAVALSHRQLEKEIAQKFPRRASPEKVIYITGTRVELTVGLSENEILKLRRAQDLFSQSRRRSVSLEETLVEMTYEYLHRHDPVQRAKRHIARKGTVKPVALQAEAIPSPKIEVVASAELTAEAEPQKVTHRTAIPTTVLHQVNLRDRKFIIYYL